MGIQATVRNVQISGNTLSGPVQSLAHLVIDLAHANDLVVEDVLISDNILKPAVKLEYLLQLPVSPPITTASAMFW
jgi:hypothetical protein